MNLPKPRPAGTINKNGNRTGIIDQTDFDALQQKLQTDEQLQRVNKNAFAVFDRLINIPLLIVTTLAAATANAPINFDLPCSGNPAVHVTLTPQVLGVTSAVLSALNNFVQPANRFEQYSNAEKRYEELVTDTIKLSIQSSVETPDEIRRNFINLLERKERIDSSAPQTFFPGNYSIGG